MARAAVPTLILGAAGRDFHDFNVLFRNDPESQVVAFTASQIPGIEGRRYPPSLAGPRYPDGIPIEPEDRLEALCAAHGVERVVFAYSDVSHATVMHLASRALAAGADFVLPSPARTMLPAACPVIGVSAVRTGCGKSQTTRWLAARLCARGLRISVIRHPMPYGDLELQAVQRFASRADLDAASCTLEEREEYEPHLAAGNVVWAGVDYERIAERAAAESDLLLWDGGNNDFPFLRPDLHIVLVDALRPDQESTHHPGEAVLRSADVIVVAKVDAAAHADVQRASEGARRVNPSAPLVRAASPATLDDPAAVTGRRVLVVDDGPTLTHGGMSYGAGYVAAVRAEPAEIVDPRPHVDPALAPIFEQYPHLGAVLPAMGYDARQREALRWTIEAAAPDVVVSGTPVDLAAALGLHVPVVRARYAYAEASEPGLGDYVDAFLARAGLAKPDARRRS